MTIRRSPLPRRRQPIARSGRIKPKARPVAEFTRVYGGKQRVTWMKRQTCIVAAHGGCDGAIECAHVVNGGMGRKADARFIVPLCHGHHAYLHSAGRDYFEEVHDVDLHAAAVMTEAKWQAHCVTLSVSGFSNNG